MRIDYDIGYYDGDVVDGEPNGIGRFTFVNEDGTTCYYEGMFRNGVRHGYGKMVFSETSYVEGEWEDDQIVRGKEAGEFGYFLGEFFDGQRHGYGEEYQYNGRTWKGKWHHGRKVQHPDYDIVPNAVRVWPLGNMDLIRVEDFSCGEGLGKPLDCNRVDIISTQWMKDLSEAIGFTVVGYIDSYASQKDVVNNRVMCELSGYDYLPGACILCGFDGDYAPLDYEEAEMLYDCIFDTLKEE